MLNNEFGDRWLVNAIIIAVGLILVVAMSGYQNLHRHISSILTLVFGIALLPLAVEAITVMSPAVDKYGTTGIIMVPTMALVYVGVIALGSCVIQERQVMLSMALAYVSVGFIVWNSVVFTNLCISSMQMTLNKTQTVADMMLDDIVEQYGYTSGMSLLVAGSMEDGNFPDLYEWPSSAIQGTSASYGMMWDTYTGNESCWIYFLKQYKGLEFAECGQEEYEALLSDPEYQNMPIFPEEGSVREMNGIIVVKMSNEILE